MVRVSVRNRVSEFFALRISYIGAHPYVFVKVLTCRFQY